MGSKIRNGFAARCSRYDLRREAAEAWMASEIELIERTYRAYFTVFQMGNPRAITPYYHIPAAYLSPTGTFVLTSVQDAEQFFERLIYGLRSRSHARSVLTSVQVKLLADDLALVNARGDRYTKDGNLCERMSSVYTMRQTDGTWRIATATNYDPERSFELR
jgi:ketosteroid isomerase-like protein